MVALSNPRVEEFSNDDGRFSALEEGSGSGLDLADGR